MLDRFKKPERTLEDDAAGATAVEYALLLSLMVLALLGALASTGGSTKDQWGNVSDKVSAAMDEAGS